jgi:radical SAM superfamily enzyme YgiQ (UPF0313 family)
MVYPNFFNIAQPSLAITYLVSYIHANSKHKVEIFDITFMRKIWKSELKKIIHKFDVLAISVTTLELYDSIEISDFVKKLQPNIRIIWGGIHVSLAPEKVLQNNSVDAICLGESEESFIEIIDNYSNKQTLEGVKGVWYKDENNKIIKNGFRCPIEDLDDYPFLNFDIWDLKRYRPYLHTIPFNGSRNCQYNCTFCTQNALKNALGTSYKYRRSSPSRIADEVEHQYNKYKNSFNFTSFVFYDDTFTSNKKFLVNLCKEFRKRGIHKKIRWSCNARIENLNRETLLMMKTAGCYYVFLGIESFSEKVRRQYGKNFTNKQVEQVIRTCKEFRIMLRLYFIVNDQLYQDYQENLNTINWAFKLAPETFHLIPYFPVIQSNFETKFKKKFPKKYDLLQNLFSYNGTDTEEKAQDRIQYSVGIGFGKNKFKDTLKNSIIKIISSNPESVIFRKMMVFTIFNYFKSLIKYGGLRFIFDGLKFFKDLILNDYKLVDFFNLSLIRYMIEYSFKKE